MHQNFIRAAAVAAVAATFSSAAVAGGFQLTEQSALGLGRAYAGMGVDGTDVSGLYYNPATMTLHTGTQAQFGFVGVGLNLDDLDAALFKERIERFHIHPALCSQSFGLLCRQGAFAFRQQFLQSHAHFALSFSLRGKRPASELVS